MRIIICAILFVYFLHSVKAKKTIITADVVSSIESDSSDSGLDVNVEDLSYLSRPDPMLVNLKNEMNSLKHTFHDWILNPHLKQEQENAIIIIVKELLKENNENYILLFNETVSGLQKSMDEQFTKMTTMEDGSNQKLMEQFEDKMDVLQKSLNDLKATQAKFSNDLDEKISKVNENFNSQPKFEQLEQKLNKINKWMEDAEILDDILNSNFDAVTKINTVDDKKRIFSILKKASNTKNSNLTFIADLCKQIKNNDTKLTAIEAVRNSGFINEKLKTELNEFVYAHYLKENWNKVEKLINEKLYTEENLISVIDSFKETELKVLGYVCLYEKIKTKNYENVSVILLANKLKYLMETESYKNLSNIYHMKAEDLKKSLPECVRNAVFKSLVYLSNFEKTVSGGQRINFMEDGVHFGLYSMYPAGYRHLKHTLEDIKGKDIKGRYSIFKETSLQNLPKEALWLLELKEDYCYLKNVKYSNEYLRVVYPRFYATIFDRFLSRVRLI